MGTIYHKVMETRALAKLALQNGDNHIDDDNLGYLTINDTKDHVKMLDLSFDYYKGVEDHLVFTDKDKRDILKWLNYTFETWPDYDPFKLDLVAAELFFDIEIKRDWAALKGVVNGHEIDGHLRIKGTMDSVIKLTDDVYELVDYKSGAHRKDFATGEIKTLEYLQNDIQLLLYLIALKETFPTKDFVLSLLWVNAGGMFSVPADQDMLDRAWEMLEVEFKKISDNYSPKQLDPYHRDYRCKYLCEFSKKPYRDTNLSVCQYFHKEIKRDGIMKVVNKNVDLKTFGKYGSGGGRASVE